MDKEKYEIMKQFLENDEIETGLKNDVVNKFIAGDPVHQEEAIEEMKSLINKQKGRN